MTKRARKKIPAPYKSWFEYDVATALTNMGIEFHYEPEILHWQKNVNLGECLECGSNKVIQNKKYSVDWYLPKYDVYLETKGKLDGPTRTKMQAIAAAYPDKDIRVVFEKNNKVRGSKKWERYMDWAKWARIPAIVGNTVTEEWLDTNKEFL